MNFKFLKLLIFIVKNYFFMKNNNYIINKKNKL